MPTCHYCQLALPISIVDISLPIEKCVDPAHGVYVYMIKQVVCNTCMAKLRQYLIDPNFLKSMDALSQLHQIWEKNRVDMAKDQIKQLHDKYHGDHSF